MFKKLFSAARGANVGTTETGGTSPAAASNTHVLQQLQRLNHDFLRLVMQAQSNDSQRWQAQLGMHPEQKALLTKCSDTELERVAGCGFSLFNAHFHQPDAWIRLHDHSVRIAPEQRYSALLPRTDTRLQRICVGVFEGVVFFAWHLAQQDPQSARLMLGMASDTLQIMTRLEIWQCQFIACQHCNLLTPRWRHNPYFWSDLLNYGHSCDRQLLRFVRAMGTQLIAQELEPSAVARLSRAGDS